MTDADSTAGVGGGEIDLAAFADANTVALSRFAFLLCGDRELAEDLVQGFSGGSEGRAEQLSPPSARDR